MEQKKLHQNLSTSLITTKCYSYPLIPEKTFCFMVYKVLYMLIHNIMYHRVEIATVVSE